MTKIYFVYVYVGMYMGVFVILNFLKTILYIEISSRDKNAFIHDIISIMFLLVI